MVLSLQAPKRACASGFFVTVIPPQSFAPLVSRFQTKMQIHLGDRCEERAFGCYQLFLPDEVSSFMGCLLSTSYYKGTEVRMSQPLPSWGSKTIDRRDHPNTT